MTATLATAAEADPVVVVVEGLELVGALVVDEVEDVVVEVEAPVSVVDVAAPVSVVDVP
jgi:hypothetical protein